MLKCVICSQKNTNSEVTVVLKLIKSLYVIVQSNFIWYQHLQKGLKILESEPSDLDKAIHYGQGIIVIT